MTTIPLAPASSDSFDDADEANPAICSACPHPRATHDAIAARYCAASESTATTRGCICPPA